MRDLGPAVTPVITQELLDYLREQYPDRVPSIDNSDRQVWSHVGAVGVVRHLESLFEEQNRNILRM
tara:strand:- start:1823 stop:2020 length:198 start_codon:yes stop_codon:yes gene_type:complete